jgi:hypothetical protein
MEHSANIKTPTTSPMWCNTAPMSASSINYDGEYWYSWNPNHKNWIIWYDTPLVEEMLGGNVCYRVNGNIWICPVVPIEESNIVQEPTPLPTNAHVKPSITVTTARMENHAEHVSVLFGQVISNLK